jgi:glycosyltransferase involved in cell wall biosynthesis
MSPVRLLHVIEAMHQGGAETVVLEHVRHASPDFDVLVCALNRGGPALEEAGALGARTFVLSKGHDRLRGIVQLARLMRDEHVDLVNGHNPTGALYATVAARLAGVKAILRTEHSTHYAGRHSGLYALAVEPTLIRMARRVICVCETVRAGHARRFPWARSRTVTVLNGISPAPPSRAGLEVRRDLGLGVDDRVALTVGSLTTQKAQHVMIEAFARVVSRIPQARLLLAGEGKLAERLRAQVRDLGLDGIVRFIGARQDVPDLLAAADVFVLSSVREGLSISILEAMRAGLAVVVTRAGGCAEAVADHETGRLVPVEDPPALADALLEILSDPERAAAMGAAGRARWSRCFSAERMVRETEALYRQVLQASRDRRPSSDQSSLQEEWGRGRPGA